MRATSQESIGNFGTLRRRSPRSRRRDPDVRAAGRDHRRDAGRCPDSRRRTALLSDSEPPRGRLSRDRTTLPDPVPPLCSPMPTWGAASPSRGCSERGVAHGQEAVRLAEALDHPFRPVTTAALGYAYARSGRLGEGVSLLQQALAAYESTGVGYCHSIKRRATRRRVPPRKSARRRSRLRRPRGNAAATPGSALRATMDLASATLLPVANLENVEIAFAADGPACGAPSATRICARRSGAALQ